MRLGDICVDFKHQGKLISISRGGMFKLFYDEGELYVTRQKNWERTLSIAYSDWFDFV